jgi:hypothetical protein
LSGHRDRFGVEPICETSDVSASACYQRASGERSAPTIQDERLTGRIREIHDANETKTTTADPEAHRASGLVKRGFTAQRRTGYGSEAARSSAS